MLLYGISYDDIIIASLEMRSVLGAELVLTAYHVTRNLNVDYHVTRNLNVDNRSSECF
jgi:hypothetical protein